MRPAMRPSAVVAAALLSLAAPLTSACGSGGKTADCASVADSIGGHLVSLEKAVAAYGKDPSAAATAIRQLQSDIDDIAGKTNNAATTKAINELSTGLADAKDNLDNGVKPNIKPLANAAAAFAKSCVPGSGSGAGSSRQS